VTFDIVFANGTIVDGSGRPAFRADVALSGDRISAIGDLAAADSETRINIDGMTLAPGFIDVHTHSDLAAFLPEAESDLRLATLRQGVTTEICGNCGFSTFPSEPERMPEVLRHVQGLFGRNARAYSTLAEFGAALDGTPLLTNIGTLVGHGTIRAGVIGFGNRRPDSGEMNRLKYALDQACEEGALGFSSGLIYSPGLYARTEELIELSRVASRHQIPYVTHMRNELDGVQTAIDEALLIGQESGTSVQISHLKVAGRRNWGRSEAALEQIEKARIEGLDVGIDVYPYTAGSTMLAALLPPWTNEGGIGALLSRLGHADMRQQIAIDCELGIPGWQNLTAAAGWDGIVVASSGGHPQFEGRAIASLATESGMNPIQFVCDLLIAEEARVVVVVHMMAEEDVSRIVASPLAVIGSDGIPLPGKPHPRWAGSFARVLEVYVRESGLLKLEQAVRKMTRESALRFGLLDRGLIAVGNAADIVILDPSTISSRAGYDNPLAPPTGILHVLVNGEYAIRSGSPTGIYAGRFLRR
jgi:N-acyl-D-aspartate/D-glutamate deacylase